MPKKQKQKNRKGQEINYHDDEQEDMKKRKKPNLMSILDSYHLVMNLKMEKRDQLAKTLTQIEVLLELTF